MIALAWLLPGWVAQHQYRAELAPAVEAVMAAPAGGIRVTDGAAMELPSDQANVRLYLVQSVTHTSPASETGPAR